MNMILITDAHPISASLSATTCI